MKLVDSDDELVNQDSGVSTPPLSKKTEFTVLNMLSPARKERVLGCLQEGHCHGSVANIVVVVVVGVSLFLKRECSFIIFLPIVLDPKRDLMSLQNWVLTWDVCECLLLLCAGRYLM